MTRGRKSRPSAAGADALARSEQRWHALAAAAAGLAWTATAQGEVAEDLPAWRSFTGQAADDIKGEGWMAALHPDDRRRTAAFWSAAREAGAPCETEFRLRRRDGEYRQVALRLVPVSDAEGAIREWIGLGLDVSERKLSEEELAGCRAQLAEARAAAEQDARAMALVDELNATLHACNSLEEAYPLLGMTALGLFPRMNGALALCDRGSRLSTVAQWGDKKPMAPEFALDDCWGLRRGQMHVLDEPGTGAECLHFTARPEGPSLCLPLVVRSDTLGLLHLDGGAGLDAPELRLVARLGEVVKIALADLTLRASLRAQAIRDPLTGLFNRQYLDETLPRECQLARRRNSPLSVAMLDIDHFKQFNDGYGHDSGDAVLRELGELLRAASRSSDITCRYGGDEFVLIMLDADLPASVPRLEQICLDIKRKRCVHRNRTLPSITVSVGMSEFPLHGSSPGEVLRAADEAMYAAKHAGRDRIVLSAGRPAEQPAPTQA